MTNPDFKYLYYLIEINQIGTFLDSLKEFLAGSIFENELTLLISQKERLEKGFRLGVLNAETWKSEEALLSQECLLFCKKVEKHYSFYGPKKSRVFWKYGAIILLAIAGLWSIWYFSGTPFRTVLILQDFNDQKILTAIDSGFVELEIGGEIRKEPIREGRAIFENIPKSYAGKTVHINLRSAGYAISDSNASPVLADGTLYLKVEKIRTSYHIFGRVQAEGKLIKDAKVILGDRHFQTDSNGFFDIPLSETYTDLQTYRLLVIKSGYDMWDVNVRPNDEVEVVLSVQKSH